MGMQVTIHKSILLKPLEQVAKALPSKEVIPILSGILFQVDMKGLTLVAGEVGLSIRVDIPIQNFEVISTGSIVMPAKFVTAIRNMEGDISVKAKGVEVTIRAGKTEFQLTGRDSEEYPEFKDVSSGAITINGGIVKSMITKTIFAASTNMKLEVLCGILMEVSHNTIKFTACDKHRLAAIEQRISSEKPLAGVIEKKALIELRKLLEDTDELNISMESNRIMFRSGHKTLISTLIEGSYPDTSKIVPHHFETKVQVSTVDLLAVLSSAMVVAQESRETKLVKLIIGKEFEIQSKVEGKKVSSATDIEKLTGPELYVSLNSELLFDALSAIDSKMTTLHFNSNLSPIIVIGDDEPNNLQLVLPYRTRD